MAVDIIDRSKLSGLIPEPVTREIIQGAVAESAVLRMARRLPNMTSKTQTLNVLDALPTAYFVNGEATSGAADSKTSLKKTTNMAWDKKKIYAEEIAVIVPIPEAVLDDSDYDIWGEVRPRLTEAFGKVIDAAVANGYDIAIQMDGDGQHDPAYLEDVVRPVAQGQLDLCIGSRFLKKEGFQTSFMRRVGIRFLSFLIFLFSGNRVLDVTSGFRACNREMMEYFVRHYATDYPEPESILAASLTGFRVGEVPVVMQERLGGVSSISAFNSVYFMIKVSLSLIISRLALHRSNRRNAA